MTHAGFPRPERQSFAPWRDRRDPPRVLLIRFHAIGDVALTLPATRGFRLRCPDSRVEVLTHATAAPLLRSLSLYDEVLEMPPASGRLGRVSAALRVGRLMREKKYDLIVDLQRNWVTRTIRRCAGPAAWGEFDRFTPQPAADRVRSTFEQCGFPGLKPSFEAHQDPDIHTAAHRLLDGRGRDLRKRLVVLNPAGLWATRNWPLDRYVELARLWLDVEPVQFLLLGTERIREAAAWIVSQLGPDVINLVGQTSLETAYGILGRSSAVISEDSGLLHLAWSRGIPVVALFGSSRHVWSAPRGPAARVFHSGDLACGQCMQQHCHFGDVRCLARRSAEEVLDAALSLLSSSNRAAA